ncbi:MAG: PstS family phosphate ABC transporter substrate-binding protein [Armatimonas sp.]
MNLNRRFALTALSFFSLSLLMGCPSSTPPATGEGSAATPGAPAATSGEIKVDGSSTVLPISEAVAEEFKKENAALNVSVGKSGTGGGFKKFIAKEIDIADASRPIEQKELDAAKAAGVEFIELPIAYDGLSVVVNPKNTWAADLTVDELKKIWVGSSKISSWKDVRVGFPDKPLKLYGPGTDSGTFDYFTEAICGKKGDSRADYTASEDDNTLVTGVAGDEGALGYFGLAYAEENKEKLKLLGISGGAGKSPVLPNATTVASGEYTPLSRPLFLYVNKAAADKPEVKSFVAFYLKNAKDLVKATGYVPLPDKAYELAQKRFESGKTGSIFGGKESLGVKIEGLLAKEGQ